jgi:hypothetical protein
VKFILYGIATSLVNGSIAKRIGESLRILSNFIKTSSLYHLIRIMLIWNFTVFEYNITCQKWWYITPFVIVFIHVQIWVPSSISVTRFSLQKRPTIQQIFHTSIIFDTSILSNIVFNVACSLLTISSIKLSSVVVLNCEFYNSNNKTNK